MTGPIPGNRGVVDRSFCPILGDSTDFNELDVAVASSLDLVARMGGADGDPDASLEFVALGTGTGLQADPEIALCPAEDDSITSEGSRVAFDGVLQFRESEEGVGANLMEGMGVERLLDGLLEAASAMIVFISTLGGAGTFQPGLLSAVLSVSVFTGVDGGGSNVKLGTLSSIRNTSSSAKLLEACGRVGEI